MEKKNILIILLMISIIVILVVAAIFVFLPWFVYNIASITQPVDVDITDLSYKEAEFGEGFTISMNVTFTNEGDTNETVSMPIIITDNERELYCDFILVDEDIDASPSKIILIPNRIVNATVITWDSNYSCECLIEGERATIFEYQLGSGIMAPPKIKKKDIPDSLIDI